MNTDLKARSNVLRELDTVYEEHKKKYGKRKMSEEELDKFLDTLG